LATSFGQAGDDGEEVLRAVARLPKRQREALELLELEQLSYEEIAARLGTSHGSVAQLIARARINLYDELRGTPLASVAAPSAECGRSLPLIAAREDGQLDPASDDDAAWLDAHLAGCDRCRPAVEQMAAAAASYRARAAPGAAPHAPNPGAAAPGGARPRRRMAVLAVSALAVALLGGLAAVLVADGGGPAPADPSAAAAPAGTNGSTGPQATAAETDGAKKNARKKKPKPAGSEATAAAGQGSAGEATPGEAAPTSVTDPSTAGGDPPTEQGSGPHRAAGKTAVNPPKQVSKPKPSSKPKPTQTSAQAPQPAFEPSPQAPSGETPPAEADPDEPGRSGEAPGKPADRPPR
jgi:outer membrane biosynthesis protein TonB